MSVIRKREFIQKLNEQFPHLSEKEVGQASDAIFAELIESLRRNERAELRGFGIFYISQRKTRLMKSPHTGKMIEILSKRIPRFKAGKELKQKVNKTPLA